MTTILYRGDTTQPIAPQLTAGTWLTEDADVATWYGCAHRYELPDDLRVLDLTEFGVGDEDYDLEEDMPSAAYLERLEDALSDAGIDPEGLPTRAVEIYMLVESPAFIAAVREAGYDAVRSEQWHAERCDEVYVAVMLVRDVEG